MSVEWFDLGQRLNAADTGHAVPRLLHAPLLPVTRPVAVRATSTGARVTVAATVPGSTPATAHGPEALTLLASLGASITAASPPTLVTDHPATLGLLYRLALTTTPGTPGDDVAALIAWWRDRADFPGGRAVVDTVTACRTRWVTGQTPEHEAQPGTWRNWLGIGDDTPSGVLRVHELLTAGPPLTFLTTLAEDDLYAYSTAQSEHGDGFDWRRPDTPSRAALGLRARCDAADLYAAALLTDPLYRLRAVHTGHVLTGTADPLGDRLKRTRLTCHRLDSRLRPGTAVTGWVGGPETHTSPFSATVSAAEVEHGLLVLTLSGVTGHAPVAGDRATIHPAAPSPARQRAGRRSYRALYAARRSWLTTGRTPTPTRRDVPLDVLVAGAEPD